MSDLPAIPSSRYLARTLEVLDSTLREGQQTSLLHDHTKYFFTQRDKEEILRALVLYGVKFIELFAPNVSAREADDFKALQSVRNDLITQKGYTFLLVHVRCHPGDIEAAIQAGFDGLNIYMGTSPQSQTFNHGEDLDRIIRRAQSLLEDVCRNHPHLILRFSGEDAFRTPLEHLYRVYDPLVSLLDRLGLPDTVGVADPAGVSNRITCLRQRYPDTLLEVHFHDDRSLALTNALAAIRAGAQFVDTTVLGIGERSGITSLTALLFNLFIDQQYDHLEGYHLRGSYPLNVLVADKLKTLVFSKEPVSLTNRTHTAGVHQGAVLKDASTYEANPLDLFGVSERDILLGPLSGWNMVHYFLKEIHYFELDEAVARQITARFKENVCHINGAHSPADELLRIARQEFHLQCFANPPDQAPRIVQRMDRSEQPIHQERT
jgi:homocitrate synthase